MSGIHVSNVSTTANAVLAQLDPAKVAAADPATAAAYASFEPVCAAAVATNLALATQEALLGTGRGDFRLQVLMPPQLSGNAQLVEALTGYLQAQLAIGNWKDGKVSVLEGGVLNVEVAHPAGKRDRWGEETRHSMSTIVPRLRVALAGGLAAAIEPPRAERW